MEREVGGEERVERPEVGETATTKETGLREGEREDPFRTLDHPNLYL